MVKHYYFGNLLMYLSHIFIGIQSRKYRVSVQGVKSLGGHFACLCRGFEFYEVKKKLLLFFKMKIEILLIIFIVKSLQKEQNSTNLLL